jgi:hypothetical protein
MKIDHFETDALMDVAARPPLVMVEAAKKDFTQRCGLPEDQFFADAFTSQADLAGA